jgi:uncharacterized protein YkwD
MSSSRTLATQGSGESSTSFRPSISRMNSKLQNSKLRFFNRNVVTNQSSKSLKNKNKTKRGVHVSSLRGTTGISQRDLLSKKSEDSFDAEKKREQQWSKSAEPNHHQFSPAYARNSTNVSMLQKSKRSTLNRERTSDTVATEEERESEDMQFKTLVKERRSSLPTHIAHFVSSHVLINRDRVKRGILPLHRDHGLDKIALDHAKLMAENLMTFHADAEMLLEKATALGPCRRIGENIGKGTSVELIHKKMMVSPQNSADKNNILDRRFTSFGVGTASSECGKKRFICQIFRG